MTLGVGVILDVGVTLGVTLGVGVIVGVTLGVGVGVGLAQHPSKLEFRIQSEPPGV